jgi:hypothetical protein
MALPSSGEISFSDIGQELLGDPAAEISITTAVEGGYVEINQESASFPNDEQPHAISEWYGYDHDAASYTNSRYYQNDGTGDYIDCTTSTSPFDINSTQDLSFSLWVRNTGSKQNQMLFNFGNTNANGNNRIMVSYSANLNRIICRVRTNSTNFDRQFALHDNSSATGISSSSNGWSSTSRGTVNGQNFCMLTITYDASQSTGAGAFKFYWNATECTTTAASNNGTRTAITSTKGRIGENLHLTDSAGNATLDYDEIKIYNKVLSSSEVTTLYNSGTIAASSQTVSSGLITEWTFDNNNANDSNSKYTNTITNGTITAY